MSNHQQIAIAHAEAEQARLERDRLGIDIGSVPPEMQEHNYQVALARLNALLEGEVQS
jgi:hypothetical protein